MQALVNASGSLKTDLKAQVKATLDCALVKAGRSPAM